MDVPQFNEQQNRAFSAFAKPGAKLSFSQFGEDLVVEALFHKRRNGFYVDVGAHDPFAISNTALLSMAFDWKGINIDVDDRAIEKFNQHRPNDINVCVGIGAESCHREVTLFDVGAVNTFDEKLANQPNWSPYFREKRLVQVSPLREILDRYLPAGQKIDYLNVDVEGLDFEAVTSNDWNKYRPELVTVEIHNLDLTRVKEDRVCAFMFENGYKLFSHLFVTALFVRIRN
jgi:hypothetical protein